MANEYVNNRNEILGIDKTTEETRRVRTNADGELIISSADLSAILTALQGTLTATLSGSSVVIGGVTFAVSGGDTLRNTSANKPTASAAHTAIPYCYYYSVDTGVVEVTNGINWVVI